MTRKQLGWLGVLTVFLVLVDAVFVEHSEFLSRVTGFYALWGMLACLGLVVISLAIGKWIKRADDYYDK